MRAAATAVLVLAIAPFLQACFPGPVGCAREEAPEFSATEEQITRNEVIAHLGEPIESINSEDGRVDVYEYDGHCAGLVFLGVPIPVFGVTDQMMTVEYGPDGSFLTAKVWRHTETTEEVIASYELQAACNLPFSEAIRLDAVTQHERSQSCRKFGDEISRKWRCFAAHSGHGNAQLSMAVLYKYGYGGVQSDKTLSYVWYVLAIRNGETRAASSLDALRSKMSPTQIAEAERLMAEWQSNPAECEIVATEADD